jgi:hypothetical protein
MACGYKNQGARRRSAEASLMKSMEPIIISCPIGSP